jgi:CheY-like chemotaxis protein
LLPIGWLLWNEARRPIPTFFPGGRCHDPQRPGEGTTVKIYLPRAHVTVQTVKEGDGPAVATPGCKSILVVEDEADVRSYLVETLRDLNYRVWEPSDGATALASFETDPSRIDLLLTDIVMPGINGRQLADELRRLQTELKVLFITGYSRDARASGATRFRRFAPAEAIQPDASRGQDQGYSRPAVERFRAKRVGWVERSETHHSCSVQGPWVSLRSTHPTKPQSPYRQKLNQEMQFQ